MKLNLLIIMLGFLSASNLFGQVNDSFDVKHLTYRPDPDKKEIIRFSELQIKAKPYYDKGYYFVGNYEFEKAIKWFKKALKIDSSGNCRSGKDGLAFSELGYAYTRIDDFTNAISFLNKAIEINKFLPTPYLNKSVLFMRQGKNDLALNVLDLLIEFVPEYAMGYAQRGFLHKSMAKYELALQDFRKYLNVIKEQNQEQNSATLVEDIKKQIAEIEVKNTR
jgi:tetratricopeptide (TPR) repeat protein